jgi:hypothetical protein
MPDQRNFDYFTYDSDDGTLYNMRVDTEWAAVAAHGFAARANGQPRYIASGQQQPRSVRYVDLTTGRSVQGPVGTAAAYAALNIGDTHSFTIRGSATAVVYTLASKRGEKVPTSVAQTHLPDHA